MIVLGPSLKSSFQGMIEDNKIFTVANCVDNEYLISDDEFSEKLRTVQQKKIKHIIYLSNFIKSKGYPIVLEMARVEKERGDAGGCREFHFDFAGKFFKREDEVFFWSYIKKYELENYITYHGIVTGEQKRTLLKNGDIFVLLSRYPKEGQPISILEAMGNGMVIVTTDHAGIVDIVKDNDTGIVIKKNTELNIYELMDRIRQLDYEEYMKRGRRVIMTDYNESNYIKGMKSVFQKI